MSESDRAELEEMLRGWCFEPPDGTAASFCTRRRWHHGRHAHDRKQGKRYLALLAQLVAETKERFTLPR